MIYNKLSSLFEWPKYRVGQVKNSSLRGVQGKKGVVRRVAEVKQQGSFHNSERFLFHRASVIILSQIGIRINAI